MKRLYAALAASAVALSAWGGYAYTQLPDRLTRVIDGDTIVINGATHVRLWGMDAPELAQTCNRSNPEFAGGMGYACGEIAKQYLAGMFKHHEHLNCDKKDTDVYGRMVDVCYLTTKDGRRYDIGKSMVAAGMAVDWPKYSQGAYAADEAYAAEHKLGVWVGYLQMPWDYRAQRAAQPALRQIWPFHDDDGKCIQTKITTDSVHFFDCKDLGFKPQR